MIATILAHAALLVANPLTPAEVRAEGAYLECLVGAARQVDDQVTDPRRIATTIAGACRDQLDGYLGALKIAIPDQASAIDGAAAEISRRDALEAVLLERRRSQEPN